MEHRYVKKKSKTARCKVTWVFCLLCITALPAWAQEQGPNPSYHLVDDVEITLELPGQKDTVCKPKFLEDWFIDTQANSILKQVVRWDSCCFEILSSIPSKNGYIPIRDISYEFHLLDPHLVASGNRAFPEPDSMDVFTRDLQAALVALISARSHYEDMYQLDQQLLSVIFHEDWTINLTNGMVLKKVRALTPVIWQRRQTEAGDPVNEADTGLPVYYKIDLKQISLRNP